MARFGRSYPIPRPTAALSVGGDFWYPLSTTTGGWGELQQGGTAPAESTLTTGWDVSGVAATQYAAMETGVLRAPGTFGGTALPGTGGPDDTLKDCFRTPTVLSGAVAAGTWTIAARLLAQATAGASVRLRFRFWRSANADGSAATQITTGPIIGSTVTVDADGEISSGAEAGLGEVTFAGEYLFVQVACETV